MLETLIDPKKFRAGTVYGPVGKEVIIGARRTFRDAAGGEIHAAVNDIFGGFWFRAWETTALLS
jgi:hypothetical protein